MKRPGNMFQTKEQNQSLETDLNELGISDLFYIEYKLMEIKVLTKVRRIMY